MKSNTSSNVFLPRNLSASRFFAFFKLLTAFIFVAYLIFVLFWTGFTMNIYRQRVVNEPDSHAANINKTHRHFFLFTGLFIAATTAIGLWSVLKENLSLSMGFLFLLGLSFVFELVGSIQSKDAEVQQLKAYSTLPELILVLLACIFDALIWRAERALSSLPIYRQTVVESRNNSRLDMHKAGEGEDNPTLNMDDESPPQTLRNNNNLSSSTSAEVPGNVTISLPSVSL